MIWPNLLLFFSDPQSHSSNVQEDNIFSFLFHPYQLCGHRGRAECVCVCVYIYVCVGVYIYIYIYIYTHIYKP